MSSIGNFLYTVFLISLAAGAAEIFAPKGETKKYVKYIVSLAVLITLAIPAVRLFKDVPDLLKGLSAIADDGKYQGIMDADAVPEKSAYAEMIAAGQAEIERYILSQICLEFGLSEESVSVTVSIDDSDVENIAVTGVNIYVNTDNFSENLINPEDVSEFVGKMIGCERVETVFENEAE
jgi:hypothetical protein